MSFFKPFMPSLTDNKQGLELPPAGKNSELENSAVAAMLATGGIVSDNSVSEKGPLIANSQGHALKSDSKPILGVDQIEKLMLLVKRIDEHIKNQSVHAGFTNTHQYETLEIDSIIKKEIALEQDLYLQEQLQREYFVDGPLSDLIMDNKVSEIIVNSFDNIWFETGGRLEKHARGFASPFTWSEFLKRLYSELGKEPNVLHPFLNGSYKGMRVHLVRAYAADFLDVRITFRKPSLEDWDLNHLANSKWCSEAELEHLKSLITGKKNFIVIGPTGSGKTTVIKALLKEVNPLERVIILEDTEELKIPNAASTKLLTRFCAQGSVPEITLADLVIQSLRMRPDRLFVGEVRGGEAKDLLMAFATGHAGGGASLHAEDPYSALIRLEMLIQLGAPQWSLTSIRRLISMSVHEIIVCGKSASGQRVLKGIYKIASLEEHGLTLEPLFTLASSEQHLACQLPQAGFQSAAFAPWS